MTRYQVTFIDGVVISVDAEFDIDAILFAEEEYAEREGKRACRIVGVRKL